MLKHVKYTTTSPKSKSSLGVFGHTNFLGITTQNTIRSISTSSFLSLADSTTQTEVTLTGNTALALGAVHAGFHAADGYPNKLNSDVIDKALKHVTDKISASWSINEATATGAALGRTISGQDCLLTMNVPGVFQAADIISSSSFFNVPRGALVYYVVTDYIPTSTQHVIDPRQFFASIKLPILEPANHQSLYDLPRIAADISKKFHTPVAILASDMLAHSEGLIQTSKARIIPMKDAADLKNFKTLPFIAAMNYKSVVQERIPGLEQYYKNSDLVTEIPGDANWGIIVNGNGSVSVSEFVSTLKSKPSILIIEGIYPLPKEKIIAFANKFQIGKLAVIEDGDRYLTDQIELLLEAELISKNRESTDLFITPDYVRDLLTQHNLIKHDPQFQPIPKLPEPILQTPEVCSSCPFEMLDNVVSELKKTGEISAAFGDIGCPALMNSFDTVVTTGVSDTIRQGYSLARPELAGQYISVTRDACEAHSGLDETRNAIFKVASGVKIILNNQKTTNKNKTNLETVDQDDDPKLSNLAQKFAARFAPQPDSSPSPDTSKIEKVLRAEGAETISVDAYDASAIKTALKKALSDADDGLFTIVIVQAKRAGLIKEKEGISQCEMFEANLASTGFFTAPKSQETRNIHEHMPEATQRIKMKNS